MATFKKQAPNGQFIEFDSSWSEEEINKLKNLWSPLYNKYNKFFGKDILNRIKKA